MDAQRLLERARELLGREQVEQAESTLNDCVEAAAAAGDEVLLTRARFLLGELLCGQGREEEAWPLLRLVIRTEREDGSLDREIKQAARLLRQMRGLPE
jgi:hypothetical protein